MAPHIKYERLDIDANIHRGNKAIHPSHNMFSYRGLLFCFKCGAIGTNQVRLLSTQCVEATFTGQRTLRYILDGKQPPGLAKWPDE